MFFRGRTGQAVGRVGLHEDRSNEISRCTADLTNLQGVIPQNTEIFVCTCYMVFISDTVVTF